MGRLMEGKTLDHTGPLKQNRYWHRSLARAAVAGNKRPGDLARLFDLTPAQVTRILESPLIIAEMARLESQAELETIDLRTELQIRQGIALKVVDKTLMALDVEDLPLARTEGMALEILDRTGYGKSAAVQKHLHLHKGEDVKELSDEELNLRIENYIQRRNEYLSEEDILDVTESEGGGGGGGESLLPMLVETGEKGEL